MQTATSSKTIAARPTTPFRRCVAGVLAAALAIATIPAPAAAQQKKKLPLVRDAEIEALLQDYAGPIFKAGGLSNGAVDIYLVNDNRFNAFVTGRRMFINTGAIMTAETPGEIIGVMAHETGHVIGGHQARMRDRLDKANIMGALAMLAGAGAIVLGGDAGAAAGPALAMGSRSTILRSLLAYKRSEEASADNSAITLLNKTHQSGRGLLRTMERFSQELLFSGAQVDPYLQSHPMPRDRIALLEDLAKKSPYYGDTDPPDLQLRHDMARAKIAAYTDPGELQGMFRKDPQGAAARYGLAISLYLGGSVARAVPIIDRLIAEQPNNPYLHEMKGEMLMADGQSSGAVAALQKAIKLDRHQSGLMRVELGHAMLETRQAAMVDKAIFEIKAGLARDPSNARGHGLLARAYAAQGNEDMARAAAAEELFYSADLKEAKQYAKIAQPKLKRGSPQWLRLQDILEYKPPKY